MHVLDHDGGLVDASCVALVAALLHFRRPDVAVNGEEVTVFSVREREPVRLSMQHLPFCVSFSLYDDVGAGETIVLVDAVLKEEQVRDGEVVISVNRHGEVCQVAKHGGCAVDPLVLLNLTRVAAEKVKVLDAFVKKRIEEDEKRRDVGGLIAELSAENAR